MATVTTSEFVKMREPVASFSMIEHKGIFTRLFEEGSLAIGDFTHDPRGFLREIFSDETKDAQRSKRLRMGLAFGLAFQLVAITAIAIAGWHHASATGKTDDPEYTVKWIDPNTPTPANTPKELTAKSETAGKNPEVLKGNPDAASKSGGSGQETPSPARQGVLPPQISNAAIISPTAPSSPSPSIPFNPTIEGPPLPPPPPAAQIGLPNGDPNTTSAGPGKGGGIGNNGEGTGVGNNKGTGGGNTPGSDGKEGGTTAGRIGSTNGITPSGPLDYSQIGRIPDSTGIIWLRRVKPIVTPEAQANKIMGYVLLEATFNADGTITDIIVRQHLDSMDDEAVAALRKATFRPATIKGVPVTLRRVPIKVNVNIN
jgi:TonB family protein